MKTKSIKIAIGDKDTATLQTELGAFERQYQDGVITFGNEKKKTLRTLAFNRVDRHGAFIGDRETEKDAFNDYIAVMFRVAHEQRKQVNDNALCKVVVKSGYSVKSGVTSAAFRTSRMTADKTPTVARLAHCQKLAKAIHEIRVELERRAEIARVQAEAEKAKAIAKEQEAMLDAPAVPAPSMHPLTLAEIAA